GRELRTAEQMPDGTRTDWSVRGGLHVISVTHSRYDTRKHSHYIEPIAARHRVWLEPRTFSKSHKTGMTACEPVYGDDGALAAVVAIDFSVEDLSVAIGRPPLDGASTIVFTRDGTILAAPSVETPQIPAVQERLLRYDDFHEPAFNALFNALALM